MNIWEMVKGSIQTTFTPRPDASAATIRKSGLAAWGAGFVVIVISSLATFPLMKLVRSRSMLLITAGVGFVGYGLMILGCYRALTGKRADVDINDSTISIARVAVGLFAAIVSLLLPPFLAYLVLKGAVALGFDPRVLFGK